MSYSINFSVIDKKDRVFDIDDKCSFYLNITYNVSDIFALAFECEEGIKILDNLNIVAGKVLIKRALIKLIEKRSEAIKLEPPNGWGNYSNTVKFLTEFLMNCQELIDKGYDDATIFIN